MKRKVIKQGNNTLTITLPREWTSKFKVEAGDEIDIEERGSSIILNTEKEINLDKVEIDVTGLDRSSIMYCIRSVYRRGFDEIVVRFDDPHTHHYRTGKDLRVMSVIKEEVARLIGIDIIEQKNDACTIKDISSDSFKDFDNILRKIFLLLLEAMQDIMVAVKESKPALLEEIEEKHDTITKFASYCLRLLNKKGYVDYKKTSYMHLIIAGLDMIADILKYSARDLVRYDKKLNRETLSTLGLIGESMKVFYGLFYKFDLKGFARLNEIRDKVLNSIDALSTKIPQKELILLTNMEHTLEIIREISAKRMGLEY